HRRQTAAICVLNIFLGWTLVGWVIALVWACMKDQPQQLLQAPSPQHPAPAEFDRAKWNALVKYDSEVGAVVERIRPLGQRWVEECAREYVALNDKQYLQVMADRVIEQAAAAAKPAPPARPAPARIQPQQRPADASVPISLLVVCFFGIACVVALF